MSNEVTFTVPITITVSIGQPVIYQTPQVEQRPTTWAGAMARQARRDAQMIGRTRREPLETSEPEPREKTNWLKEGF